jgi:hypothetical protein
VSKSPSVKMCLIVCVSVLGGEEDNKTPFLEYSLTSTASRKRNLSQNQVYVSPKES